MSLVKKSEKCVHQSRRDSSKNPILRLAYYVERDAAALIIEDFSLEFPKDLEKDISRDVTRRRFEAR